MLDQGSVRTKVSKIFTCNCWPRNRFAIGLLPDLRPEQISNYWASRVRTIDQASRPFGPSVRTLDRVIWPKSPRFVRIVGRVYPILSGVLSYIAQDSNPYAMASGCSLIRSARTAASSCDCLESRVPISRRCVLRKHHRLSSIKIAVEKQLGCSGTPSLYEIYFM